ncbi:MAG: TIGR03545 family protein [Nitrospirota bacterium]
MKIIRWWGVLAFVLVVSLIGFFWLMMIDGIIKRAIERNGTKIIGARVNLDHADLSFFPMGLTLTRLQVTDRDEPMKNAVEIKRIAMSLDPIRLLSRKVIIEEMTMDGMAFHTPRKTSGAIAQKAAVPFGKRLQDTLGLPAFETPDLREILEKEELKTLILAEAIRKDFDTGEARWKQTLSEIPDQEKLKGYRARILELKAAKSGKVGDVLKAKADFEVLRAEIKQEVAKIKQAKNDLQSDLQHLKGQVEAIVKAPEEDIKHLAEKYSLTPEGLTRLSRTLFGSEVTRTIDTGFQWYNKFKPVMDWVEEKRREQAAKPKEIKKERFKGIDVRFREYAPLPDFLIRKIKVSAISDAGAFSGIVRDVTGDQPILGRPTTFRFSGEQMTKMESFALDGSMNRIHPKAPVDEANLQIKNWGLKSFALAKSERFPVVLTEGMASLTTKMVLRGESVVANTAIDFRPITILAGPKEMDKPLIVALASALMDIKGFHLSTKVIGTHRDYDLEMESDLDVLLKASIETRVREQIAILKVRLKEKVMEKVAQPIADVKARMGQFAPLLDELITRGKIGDELLEKYLNEAKEMAQERLDEEKRKLEEKAKEELKKEEEKQKEKLKEKLFDKLKLPF